MKLDQLEYFLKTAKLMHVGKAARQLHITPSAVSHSIAALEEELGNPLLEKNGKNIALTAHGRLLAEKAETILLQVRVLREELSSQAVEQMGHYRFGGPSVLCQSLLLPLWIKAKGEHEKLTAEILHRRSSETTALVLEGELDLGLAFSPHSLPGLEVRPLYSDPLGIYVRKGHPLLRARNPLPLLKRWGAVFPKAFAGNAVCESHPVLAEHGVTPRIELEVDNYECGFACVESTDCWGFFPRSFARRVPGLVAVSLPASWQASTEVCLLRRKDGLRTRVLTFMERELLSLKRSRA